MAGAGVNACAFQIGRADSSVSKQADSRITTQHARAEQDSFRSQMLAEELFDLRQQQADILSGVADDSAPVSNGGIPGATPVSRNSDLPWDLSALDVLEDVDTEIPEEGVPGGGIPGAERVTEDDGFWGLPGGVNF